jgi:DNA-binding MarR family transcriptional regulator
VAVNEERSKSEALGLQQVARLVTRAERALTRHLTRTLEREASTVDEWRALALLIDGRSRPMSELAEFAMVPAPSLTRLVDRMVSENLVYRKVDPRDRRRVLVRVAPRGEALHRRLLERLAEDDPLAALDDVQRAQLVAILNALIERLRERGA